MKIGINTIGTYTSLEYNNNNNASFLGGLGPGEGDREGRKGGKGWRGIGEGGEEREGEEGRGRGR